MRYPLAAFAVLGLLGAPVTAAVVFQSGDTGRSGGTEMTALLQAHDFRLTAPASLTGASFYALDLFDNIRGQELNYAFYSDAAGLPGTLVASGVASSLRLQSLGRQGGFGDSEFRVSFRFAEAVDIGAGADYWFGLQFSDGAQGALNILWVNIPQNNTAIGAYFENGAWTPSITEASFALETGAAVVPEPASWALMITGFGLTGVGLRRRRGLAVTV